MDPLFVGRPNMLVLFEVAKEYIRTEAQYEIGEPEWVLLSEIISNIESTAHGSESVVDKNKRTVAAFTDIVIRKITGPRALPSDFTASRPPLPESLAERINTPSRILTTDILVTSASRDVSLYPSPNNYHYTINSPIRNILSMELISAEIPRSEYNVHTGSSILSFQETTAQQTLGTWTTAVVAYGYYTGITDLGSAIENALNAASTTGAMYTVDTTTLAVQHKISISSDHGGTTELFNLKFTDNLASLTGFVRDTEYSGSLTFTAPNVYDLSGERYVILKLQDVPGKIYSSDPNLDRGFVKIPLNDTIKFFLQNTDYKTKLKFTPPLNQLTDIVPSFWTVNGLYDFNGADHSFVLRVKHFVNS